MGHGGSVPQPSWHDDKAHIQSALDATRNVTAAARLLGVHVSTLWKYMGRLGLSGQRRPCRRHLIEASEEAKWARFGL